MDSRRPSRTTATGARPADPGRARTAGATLTNVAAGGALRVLAALFLATLLALSAAGCSPEPSHAEAGDRLSPGRTLSVDLDGDGAGEEVLLAEDGRLVVTDGPVVYHSREKWRFLEAFIGDTDGNGLSEVTALLESDEGRHVGLFAWMGDHYRERLVTSPLTPRPLSLRVVPGPPEDPKTGEREDATATPNLVVLTEEVTADGGAVETVYRWNGFGFTAIDLVDP
jgi:hypothetical protein